MWILDSNADFMQGKRMWLKPGQRYLFGRVKKDGVMLAIDHKTVSRQHFTITVDPVKEGDVGNILARTKVRVEDHSKTGTFVNGEPLKKKDPKNEAELNPSTELKRAENSIRPGTCPYEFTLTWQACVLTFNLLKKEIKAGVLKDKQARVRDYDIKGISEFSNHTTHVVAAKRNTPKGLQALVNGKHLVTEAYLDALDYATTPATLSQDVNLSPLEIDFDVNWPDPKEYLPPPGKEPTAKPPEAYQPDTARASVFEHYTFVFCDQNQYDNLMPVITDGHGKALLFKVVNAETTGDDLLQFVQCVAGRKHGETLNGCSKGGVILVRPSVKDDALQEWTNTIINETVLKMDQRAIDQSEFLEAILSNDAGVLKETVPFESTNDSIIAPAPTAANSLVSPTPTSAHTNGVPGSQISDISAAPEADTRLATNEGAPAAHHPRTASQNVSQNSHSAEPTPRPFSAPKISQALKFKNFDDGFDPDAIDEHVDDEVVEEAESDDPEAPRTQPGLQTQVSNIKQEPLSTARKRQRSPESADLFANQIDDLLPAATGLKRQKLAEAVANGRLDVEVPQPQKSSVKKIKKEKVLDVREAVRKRLEEQEARKDDSHMGLPDIEDKAPANLVQVVTLDLPLRDKSNGTKDRMNGDHGSEWDPKWNGRKNFKAFRRKGDPPQRRVNARKVIVPLEPVPIKSGGLGDQYWPRSEEEREVGRQRRRKEEARSQRTTQSQTQQMSGNSGRRSKARVVVDDDDDDDMDASGGEDGQDRVFTQTSPATSRLQREAAEIAEHEIDPTIPRRTRAADRNQGASVNGSDTKGGGATQRRTEVQRGKRPASSIVDTSKPKRQKTLRVTNVRNDDSDDDDDMKFRFGTRARRGRGRGRGGGA
ncbi:hypothetical protein A1O7_01295 [Cladophialophora yegresii CBS 114405]|uniref:FHA domain-containing protein n=1 Tax=Cladophialophora yegresii CBS 114405 TaxID=1182544 RepID=W9WK25_9EURO|nr:uncharacterized protein A1O7_01295 [Cladophialophora yegresii CBS 114405]EXJ64956.1 hypothetical protein A1O7_01295 [Cladophialophora yegresii CBS 114405]